MRNGLALYYYQSKQLQSQTNTPKTCTPRTNTTSTEKLNINIHLAPCNSDVDQNRNHTPRTVSNFQKFLAKKLNFTLGSKPQPKPLHLNDFQIGPCKGEGRFVKVYPAWHKRTGFLVAIKKINKEALHGMLMQFIGQLKIGMFVSHANVVKTYGIFDDSTFIYILMEYMEEGSLYRFVRNRCMDEDDATCKLLEVCQAVNHLHSLGIIHRDIKPQNIVVSNGVCKLKEDHLIMKFIWAIGFLAFAMLSGKAPFQHVSHEETMESIMKCAFMFPEGMASDAKALHKDPKQKNHYLRALEG